MEETLVYGTDPHLPDTDNDGFLMEMKCFIVITKWDSSCGFAYAKLVQKLGEDFLISYKWTEGVSENNGFVL